jgi:GTP-binding protein HflX
LAWLASHGEILSKQFNDSRVTVHCRIPQKHVQSIHEEDTVVRPHRTNGSAAAEAAPDGRRQSMEDVA